MNVAIYGGSFDPVHEGHLDTIKIALKKLDINRLIVVPAFRNPFKTTVSAPAELRLLWLKKLCKACKKVTISDFETNQNRPVPTIKTVKHFKRKYKNIYLIIGSDNLRFLHKWHQFSRLSSNVTFVVASRRGYPKKHPYISLKVQKNICSTSLRGLTKHNFLNKEIKNYYAKKN